MNMETGRSSYRRPLRGDPAAFAALAAPARGHVVAVAARLVGADEAEDVVATRRRHVGRRSRRLGLARRVEASSANSDKSRSATRRVVSLGDTVDWTFLDEPVGNFVEAPVRAVDEAVLGRLRHAIDAEAGNEEEQLSGVLRMLGAKRPDKNQISLFSKAPAGQSEA